MTRWGLFLLATYLAVGLSGVDARRAVSLVVSVTVLVLVAVGARARRAVTTVSAAPPFGRPAREPALVLTALALAGGAALAGALAGYLVVSGRPAAVLALAVVLLPVVLWRRPALGPPFVVAAALLVEQFDHFGGVGPGSATVTTSIPLFHGLGPLPVNSADVLLGLLLAIYVAKAGTSATGPWPRTPLALAVGAVLATVLLGVGLGIARGGDTRFALLEARPYLYLGATFLLGLHAPHDPRGDQGRRSGDSSSPSGSRPHRGSSRSWPCGARKCAPRPCWATRRRSSSASSSC